MMVVQIRLEKFIILILLCRRLVVSQIKNPIMIKETKFSVIIFKGRVMRLRIGFMKNSRRPNIRPAKRIVSSLPSETTPEMK
jgi:hypothetical protein